MMTADSKGRKRPAPSMLTPPGARWRSSSGAGDTARWRSVVRSHRMMTGSP
jgi:hypothetical protein